MNRNDFHRNDTAVLLSVAHLRALLWTAGTRIEGGIEGGIENVMNYLDLVEAGLIELSPVGGAYGYGYRLTGKGTRVLASIFAGMTSVVLG